MIVQIYKAFNQVIRDGTWESETVRAGSTVKKRPAATVEMKSSSLKQVSTQNCPTLLMETGLAYFSTKTSAIFLTKIRLHQSYHSVLFASKTNAHQVSQLLPRERKQTRAKTKVTRQHLVLPCAHVTFVTTTHRKEHYLVYAL